MLMNKRREERGSIDFDLPEPVIEFDDQGQMRGVTKSERTWANRLIEEFMLAANECVATWLEDLGVPSLYRIHEKPEPRRVVEFEELAASFGQTLGLGALPVKRVQTHGDRRDAQRTGRATRVHRAAGRHSRNAAHVSEAGRPHRGHAGGADSELPDAALAQAGALFRDQRRPFCAGRAHVIRTSLRPFAAIPT